MSWWLLIGAVPVAFLLGGLGVAEVLCRRARAQDDPRWTNDEPAP